MARPRSTMAGSAGGCCGYAPSPPPRPPRPPGGVTGGWAPVGVAGDCCAWGCCAKPCSASARADTAVIETRFPNAMGLLSSTRRIHHIKGFRATHASWISGLATFQPLIYADEALLHTCCTPGDEAHAGVQFRREAIPEHHDVINRHGRVAHRRE